MPGRVKLEWTVPETLSDEQLRKQDLLSLMKEQTVIGLFRRRRISAGYAAQLLDMEKQDFLDLVARGNIPVITRTTVERKRHGEAVRAVLRELKAEGKQAKARTGAKIAKR